MRWKIQAIIASIFEVAVLVAPWWLVWDLQKPLHTKLDIATPFTLRIMSVVLRHAEPCCCILLREFITDMKHSVVLFTGFRLSSFNTAALATDRTLHETSYICWTQAELSYAIIATTFPSARRLVVDLITYYNGGGYDMSVAGASRSGTVGDTVPMRPMRSGKYKSEITHAGMGRDRGGSDGGNSQEMIIRKDVTFDIQHEHRLSR